MARGLAGAFLAVALAAPTAGLEVLLVRQEGEQAEVAVFARRVKGAAPGSEAGAEAEPLLRLRRLSRDRFELDSRVEASSVRVSCEAPGIWCPEVPGVTAEEGVLRLAVVPTTPLVLKFEVPHGESPPTEVVVQGRLQLATGPAKFQRTLAVAEEKLAFDVPAAPIDIRVAAQGWAPWYRFGVEGRGRPAPIDLGTWRLLRGSSVAGVVRDHASGDPLAGARLTLVPSGVEDLPGAEERARLLARRATADDWGFFQFHGVAPGGYALTATATGRAPARVAPVTVDEESESFVRGLELGPPLTLQVLIAPDPPPPGEAWLVKAMAEDGSGDEWTAVADAEGRAVIRDLVPGVYALTVGTLATGQWWMKELRMEEDVALDVALPFVELMGRIRLEGEPLRGTVEVSTGNLDRVSFQADEDGRFGGALREPDHDKLFLTVRVPEGQEFRLEVDDPQVSNGRLELDLDLEDRRISGIVVDHHAEPVPAVKVRLHRPGQIRPAGSARTDATGRFRFGGLGAGRYRLEARRTGGGVSAPVEADLRQAREVEDLRLVLEAVRDVELLLRTVDGQAVPGARVESWSIGGVPYADANRSRLDGSLHLSATETATHLSLKVMAAAMDLLWAGCVALPEEGPVTVTLAPGPGGLLVLEGSWHSQAGGEAVVVTGDGGLLTTSDLLLWLRERGLPADPSSGALESTGLSAGLYGAARTWNRLALAAEVCLLPSVRRGFEVLSPGGELALSPPGARPATPADS